MVRKHHKANQTSEAPSQPATELHVPPNLEDQLASVVEREGITVLSPDGVRFLKQPSTIEVSNASKRRRRRPSSGEHYKDRPTVSKHDEERERDTVADLDRIVVGFGKSADHRMRTASVPVRHAEHARSPFVVSLRGLSLAGDGTRHAARVPLSDTVSDRFLPVAHVPNVGVLAAMASDLGLHDDVCDSCFDQFTPPTFESAYALSYGYWNQWVNMTAQSMDEAVHRFQGFFSPPPTSHLPPPVSSDNGMSGGDMESMTVANEASLPLAALPRVSFVRVAAGVSALLVVATLPGNAVRLTRMFEGKQAALLAAGQNALGEIKVAADTSSIPEGADALRRASSRFREADAVLNGTSAVAVGLANVLPSTRATYQTARALVDIGSKSTDAAGLLAKGFVSALADGGAKPLERIDVLAAYANGALPLLDEAAGLVQKIDPAAVPESQREKVTELTGQVESGRLAVREFVGLADLMGTLLGRNESRRYLVVFQNPSELRATGGFIGSFAEVVVDRGEIKTMSVPPGGSYALQGQLTARIAPPEPLTLVSDHWEFQDSNWSPDFNIASSKIRYFWSKTGGPTVDGVIAVNSTVVQRLLALTGPVEVPELGKTITAENFILETQKAVELEYDRTENQPKKILSLLAPRIIERLKALPHDGLLALLASLSDAIETKDIQIALSQPDEESQAERLGWNGALKSTSGDSLAVIGSNIGGQKTDAAIRERVEHTAEIKSGGSITDTVRITREHTAGKGELFSGVRNVEYFRFYVPAGSTLIDAQGFSAPDAKFFSTPRDDVSTDADEAERAKTLTHHPSGVDVWEEGDRTVFGGWHQIDPGQTLTLTLTYRLPFTASDIRARLDAGPDDGQNAEARAAYSLLLTSQSGKARQITSSVKAPEGWTVRWSPNPDKSVGLSEVWDRDRVVSALYQTDLNQTGLITQ
jgi:hypothetical protein